MTQARCQMATHGGWPCGHDATHFVAYVIDGLDGREVCLDGREACKQHLGHAIDSVLAVSVGGGNTVKVTRLNRGAR
jgi:hypothetical protein